VILTKQTGKQLGVLVMIDKKPQHKYGTGHRRYGVAITAALTATILVMTPVTSFAKKSDRDVDLVVNIIVDMLKGETPYMHYHRLNGGIKYLIDNGVSFTDAHYQHSTTFTAVGHAVAATGAPAAQHGLAGNDWADRVTGDRIYCVADPDSQHHIETGVRGTSPRNVMTTTIADEIVLSQGGNAKNFAVSVKDRGAIIPGGRTGKAFYYNPWTGDFNTSTYYYEKGKLPKWLTDFNSAGHKDRYRGQKWELLHPIETYVHGHQPERVGEKGYYRLGHGFPKYYEGTPGAANHGGSDDGKSPRDYYGGLRFTPAADELTLDLAREIIMHERLGQRGYTDILSISLSNQDYIGHAWGTHSLEYEDQFLQVDRMLGEFIKFLDEKVGLDRVVFSFTADHASDDIPEYMATQGLDTGRHVPNEFVASANEAVKKEFGIQEDLIFAFWNPSLFFNPEVMKKNNLDYPTVERFVANHMRNTDGFKYAYARTDIEQGNVPNNPITSKLVRAFSPERSGNVLMIQDQFWYLYPNVDQFAAMHGSPYAYDTHVPVMFAGPGIPRGKIVNRSIAVSNIVPTLAKYLNVRHPAGSDMGPLPEVLGM
jgi:arylsulfatase A-like enzyme